ncbi:hypothetical protein ATE47_13470 [Chryseobacterium sp. IHB B 17019]|uniref:hypothetical protein n=1 Tax=Chryseobacterium sp. IHB B 17019 TaxID=1721091 RepID=UPI0007215AE2|nr:hypothetical protein [Chryseobacterium sp. IHB B 17019]ALR31464.1 hypothetical protein ATE47_13470 [Chryseobacterium sp. IHB B 17019]
MNENITIELSFNEKFERENQNFYFKYVWSKSFKGWIRIIIFTLVFLLLGFYPIKNFETSLLFYLFRYGGIFLCGYCFILIYQYFISKRKFKKEADKIITEYKNKNESSFIILDQKSIEFKNPFTTVNTIWEKISYIKLNDYIFVNAISNLYFIINKSELKDGEFEILLNYLQKYSQQQK